MLRSCWFLLFCWEQFLKKAIFRNSSDQVSFDQVYCYQAIGGWLKVEFNEYKIKEWWKQERNLFSLPIC